MYPYKWEKNITVEIKVLNTELISLGILVWEIKNQEGAKRT